MNNKKEKGITLVALVVTIIVLLILAGVTISLTVGNNGLFTRAGDAANTWKKLDTNEQMEIESFANTYDETVNNLALANGNEKRPPKPVDEIIGGRNSKYRSYR